MECTGPRLPPTRVRRLVRRRTRRRGRSMQSSWRRGNGRLGLRAQRAGDAVAESGASDYIRSRLRRPAPWPATSPRFPVLPDSAGAPQRPKPNASAGAPCRTESPRARTRRTILPGARAHTGGTREEAAARCERRTSRTRAADGRGIHRYEFSADGLARLDRTTGVICRLGGSRQLRCAPMPPDSTRPSPASVLEKDSAADSDPLADYRPDWRERRRAGAREP